MPEKAVVLSRFTALPNTAGDGGIPSNNPLILTRWPAGSLRKGRHLSPKSSYSKWLEDVAQTEHNPTVHIVPSTKLFTACDWIGHDADRP
jgi:hypothetical protein